ncbi:MAG TPA: hypothetical protein VKB12_01295 [Pyrinomonadaceae bacterium]|nr:hypothetical protein [Pyrinomonadaceae bacterium]
MPKFSFEQYKNIFEEAIRKYEGNKFFADLKRQRGLPDFPSDPDTVAIIGIRHEGKKTGFREDTADDIIVLVRIDARGNKLASEYVGTTEPGLFSGGNALGVFKLLPGFYYFKLGKHHGKNPCLVQDCAVLGERAKEGKDWDETDETTWQITDGSLHIHAGIKNLNHVGNWSAGCTVIAGGWEGKAWAEFFSACRKATNFPIPYVLVREADIPELLASAKSRAASGANGANGTQAAAAPQTIIDDGGGVDAPTPPKSDDVSPADEARAPVAAAVADVAPPPPTAAPLPRLMPDEPRTTSVPESQAAPVQASTGSTKRTNATIVGVAVALIAGIKGFMESNPVMSAVIIIAVVAAVIWLITWYIHVQRDLDKKRMELAADPGKKPVR